MINNDNDNSTTSTLTSTPDVMSTINKCQVLCQQCERVYSDFKSQLIKYASDLEKWHAYLDKKKRETYKSDQFDQSQYIEWTGQPFNCILASQNLEQAEKCKCQQLYGNRRHLFSHRHFDEHPPQRQDCELKGYLDNHKLYNKLCEKHLEANDIEYSCSCLQNHNHNHNQHDNINNDGNNDDNNDNIIEPLEPMLYFPAITCLPCRKEFENLMMDFNYHNLSLVKECIQNIGKPQEVVNNPSDVDLTTVDSKLAGSSLLIQDPNIYNPNLDYLNNPFYNPIFLINPPIKQETKPSSFLDKLDGLTDGLNATTKNKQSRTSNVTIVVISILLLLFSVYLIHCIYKNIPYDVACSKVSLVKQTDHAMKRYENDH